MNRALFLDRDGVINEDYGYVHKIEDFHFREGIFDVCRAAQKARMKIIVVTNQAGIGRGYYGFAEYEALTSYMCSCFYAQGLFVHDVFCCPYHPSEGLGHFKHESFDRKPSPGMLVRACKRHNINPKMSVMVGDKDSDRVAAFSTGILHYVDARKPDWHAVAKKSIQEVR